MWLANFWIVRDWQDNYWIGNPVVPPPSSTGINVGNGINVSGGLSISSPGISF